MPHYYDAKQETPLRLKRITVSARGQTLELWSGNGVFSKDALDDGTKLLLDTAIIEPGWSVHDLGCGIGVVGIVVKRAQPSCAVLCSDVSERAVELAGKNVVGSGIPVEVRCSDGYAAIPETFDTVLFNPPYVAGRETIYHLLQEAHDHLKTGGLLQMVARHNKGGATLKARLLEVFSNCDDTRRAKGYRVYVSKR